MTLAEQLRNEINVERDLPWLREEVMKHIKGSGQWCVICDTHINSVSKNFSLPNKYFVPVSEWARKEGLSVQTVYNGYGVKHIKITL